MAKTWIELREMIIEGQQLKPTNIVELIMCKNKKEFHKKLKKILKKK
jgi:hypothetical protein